MALIGGTGHSGFGQRVYLNGGTRMWRVGQDQDTREPDEIVRTEFIRPRKLAVDPLAGKVYWGDWSQGGIRRADLDGSAIEDVFVREPFLPGGVALDLVGGKIYWGVRSSPRKIQRANLDGTDVEDIVLTNVSRPNAIALDPNAARIYWTDHGTNTISRSELDGAKAEVVLAGLSAPTALAVDSLDGKMYWAETGNIRRANLDGSDVEDLIARERAGGQIALDVPGRKMYWLEGGPPFRIMRANLDGTEIEEVLTVEIDIVSLIGLALDVSARKLYWSDDTLIMRANLDGSDREGVIVTVEPRPGEVGLDLDAGKMYWAEEFNANRVRRSNLDGSDVEDLVNTSPLSAFGIALDLEAEKMYWSERRIRSSEGWIRRANLDGTGIEDVVGGDDFGWPSAIALDLTGGRIYWVWNTYWLGRANLDGTVIEVAIAGGVSTGIAIDEAAAQLYWSSVEFGSDPVKFPELRRIIRADLDLSVVEVLVIGTPAAGVALDLFEGHIYWTELTSHDVFRSNLDGSGVGFFATVPQGSAVGLAVDPRILSDCDEDRVVTLSDHQFFLECLTGPGGDFAWGCSCADENGDRDIDLADFAPLQRLFAGNK